LKICTSFAQYKASEGNCARENDWHAHTNRGLTTLGHVVMLVLVLPSGH